MKKTILILTLAALCTTQAEIKTMSWNIFQCWGWKDRIPHRIMKPGEIAALPDIAKVISREKPTWVAVQEIACRADHAGFVDQPSRFAAATGMHVTFAAGDGATNGWGNAIFSQTKPKTTRILKLESKDSPRSVIIADFGDYYVMATHMPLKAPQRLASAEIICREAKTLSAEKPVFLAGDLNATDDEASIRKLCEVFTILTPNVPTFPSHKPRARIDFIMLDTAHASRGTISDAHALPGTSDFSDHIPIVATFR